MDQLSEEVRTKSDGIAKAMSEVRVAALGPLGILLTGAVAGIKMMAAGIALLGGAMLMNPIGLIVTAIAAIGAAFYVNKDAIMAWGADMGLCFAELAAKIGQFGPQIAAKFVAIIKGDRHAHLAPSERVRRLLRQSPRQ
jgi:hypothetical protein